MIGPDAEDGPGRRLRFAADALARYRFTPWRYGDSIGFEGLLAAAEMFGDPSYRGYVHGFVKAWAGWPDRHFVEIDNTVPGHALCQLFEQTGDDALIAAACDVVGHLRERRRVGGVYVAWERAPLRPPYGGASLDVYAAALLSDPGPGVFVDCMHFDPPFFAHLGRLIGDQGLVEEAVAQALGHVALLRDDDGLFWHFFLERSGRAYGKGWGRGQGWAFLGLLDLLDQLEMESPERAQIAAATDDLARVLSACQRADGGFFALVHDPESGDETSTAAFVAAGLSRCARLGFGPPDAQERAERAFAYALERCRSDGTIAGISAAVWPCTELSHYAHLPSLPVVPWGQGPLLVAAAELTRSHPGVEGVLALADQEGT